MTKWMNTIDLKEVWKTNDQIQIAASAASQLFAIINAGKTDHPDDAEEIFDAFFLFVDANIPDVEEFDGIMSDLYDWGDLEISNGVKTCWIATQ